MALSIVRLLSLRGGLGGVCRTLLVCFPLLMLACCDSVVSSSPTRPNAKDISPAAPRIVALLPFAADQLLELGVKPVAVPKLRGVAPAAWEGIPTIALDHSAGPNLEQLMAAAPDIVITSGVYAQFLPAMEKSTRADVVVMDVESIDDVAGHIRRLGELTGKRAQATALIEKNNARLGSKESGDISVLAVFGTPHAFYAFLPDSYLGDIVEHCGGKMMTDDLQSHGVFRGLAPLSMEAVIERDPDQVLVVFHGPEESARAMLERDALWGKLDAVTQGRIAFLQDDLFAMRPGSELPRAIREIRTIIHGVKDALR